MGKNIGPVVSSHGLENHALGKAGRAHWNYSSASLYQEALRRDEGTASVDGALVTVTGNEAYLAYQVYNEAIVVPETIDAIRALSGTVTDAETSIRLTDRSLGMRQDFLTPPEDSDHDR